jgi:hypothetical protein
MKHKKFDLETELRTGRSAPRAEFTQALVDEVRSSGPARSPLARVGGALALSGLIVVALASFGGIGYASSSASHAAKTPTKQHARAVKTSAAHAQYAPFTPPSAAKPTPSAAKPTPSAAKPATGTNGAAGTEAASPAPQVKSAELPFTGLALWVPLAFGLAIVSIGLVLRTRGRRRDVTH